MEIFAIPAFTDNYIWAIVEKDQFVVVDPGDSSVVKKFAKNSNLQVITTEKDFCRLKKYNLEGIDYLRVELTIDQEDLFLDSLLHIYD